MTISFFLTLGLLQRFDLSYLYPFQGLSVILITRDGGGRVKGEVKLATDDRLIADQRRDRAGFTQLGINCRATVRLPPQDLASGALALQQQRPELFERGDINSSNLVRAWSRKLRMIEFRGKALFPAHIARF